MTRVYISGAITGTTDYMERFAMAELKLLGLGYEVVNPSTILSHIPTTSTHDEYMHISYALMDICDTICMMDGWRESKGAKLEYDYAIKHEMNFYILNSK